MLIQPLSYLIPAHVIQVLADEGRALTQTLSQTDPATLHCLANHPGAASFKIMSLLLHSQ